MTRTIPFPPAPEPGWYADDALPVDQARPARTSTTEHEHELAEDIASIADEPFDAEALDGADEGIPATLAAALSDMNNLDDARAANTDGASGRVASSDGVERPADGDDPADSGSATHDAPVGNASGEAGDDPYPATSAAIPLRTVPMTVRDVPASAERPATTGLVGLSGRAPVDATSPKTPPAAPTGSPNTPRTTGAPASIDSSFVTVPSDRMAHSAQSDSGREDSPATHRRTYLLRNESTHQSIVVDASMLLGRRPSNPVPDGAKIVQLEDPTRTISRNHATITMDEDDRLWLADCDSLNGTYLVVDGHDRKLAPGEAIPVVAPAVIRFGDQLFDLTEN